MGIYMYRRFSLGLPIVDQHEFKLVERQMPNTNVKTSHFMEFLPGECAINSIQMMRRTMSRVHYDGQP